MMDTPQEGYRAKDFGQPTKRFCQTLCLRNEPALIAEYRRLHRKGIIWQEILDGIREAGILNMEIYLHGTRLFMIVETPLDFDWETANKRLATLPRQAEWETLTSRYQKVETSHAATEKWQLMEQIFHLY